jgi:hypothetical protein
MLIVGRTFLSVLLVRPADGHECPFYDDNHALTRTIMKTRITFTALAMAAWLGAISSADERPAGPVRATSGDHTEPKWDQQLTVTVGPEKADIVGRDQTAIQAAIEYVARFGGGTVHVQPGTYRLRNSIFLRSTVRLLGSGALSILVKEPSRSTKLADNSDWYEQEITLGDSTGFQVGDGVCLRSTNPHTKTTTVLKRTLVASSGGRFKLDRALRENFWLREGATAATLFPILCGENITDAVIENITLDGNRANNAHLDGNHAGCIFLQDCARITIRGVTARNYNGDGISWQICHDVRVENCHSHDNAGLGLHPGSGSQRPVIRGNKLQRNDIGIFFCWGVRGGIAEKNLIEDNHSYGVSIGHRDTDNLVRDNDIVRSGKVGVLFRPERGQGFTPDRNRIQGNRIVDSGPAGTGVGIDIQGLTDGTVLTGNIIRESRASQSQAGIRIAATVGSVQLEDNEIAGYPTSVLDLRKK